LPYKLGSYELFDHIGKGGMADIYRAKKASEYGAVRQVVVKEVLPELAQHERFAELLVAEAKLAARLDHTNIVRVEHLGRDEGTLYIAMELVEGLDLRELLRRCARQKVPLPVELSLRIALEVLKGLDFAHRFRWEDAPHPSLERRIGIVHRDVSPSNVLLSFDGEVKICDFGIARAHDEPREDGQPLSAAMVEGKALDGRADVYALGIILWELLSGRKLYKAGPGETLLDVAKRAHVPKLPARDLPFEAELHRIVERALSPSLEGRYASAAAMMKDLEAYVARSGLVASSLKLGSWLAEHFEGDILRAQRSREKAVLALSRGPVAKLTVIEPEPTPEPREADAPTPRPKNKKTSKKRKDAKAMDEPPKSLEGTSADIETKRSDPPKRLPLGPILVVLVLAGLVAAYLLHAR
jgi:serine/threonine-protein kinase